MKIPDSEHSIHAKIDKHHESLAEPPRPHRPGQRSNAKKDQPCASRRWSELIKGDT